MEVLKATQTRVVRLVGLVSEVCITANALDALDNGFDVEIFEKGVR